MVCLGIALDAVTKDSLNGANGRQSNVGTAIEYLSDLRHTLKVVPREEADTLTFWSHQSILLYYVKNGRVSAPNREALEKSVGRYLDLPFRSATIDRTLVDALVATELVEYGSRVYSRLEPLSVEAKILAVRPGRTLAGNLGIVIVFFAILALAVHWLAAEGHYPAEWVPVSLVCVALLFGLSGIATIMRYPRYVRDVRKAQDQVRAPLRAILETYDSMNSEGPLSLERVRASVNRAASAKVKWPLSLYPLLDDIAARSTRL